MKRGFVVGQAVRDDHGDSRPGSTLESSRARVADGVECKLAEAVVTTRRPNVANWFRRGFSFYNGAGAERQREGEGERRGGAHNTYATRRPPSSTQLPSLSLLESSARLSAGKSTLPS